MCGRLNYSLYGTRDAASNWEECYGDALKQLGFTQGKTSPCVFYHSVRDISTVVHGDDFTSLATEKQLIWMRDSISEIFSIKDRGILGPERHDLHEIRLLSRIISWTLSGLTFEADQRHGEILVDALNIKDAKGVDTPGTVENKKLEDDDEGDYLAPHLATAYRACAARCNYLGLDRPDLQFASKEVTLSKFAVKPK